MITKKRLEELIEQGATIYIIKTEPFIAGYVNKLKVVPITLNNCYGISTEKYNKKHNCKPQFYYSAFVFEDICDVDKVFETKEEAEWYLKFGNITRTETLSLPTFEEIIKEIGMNGTYNIEFTSKNEWDECTLSVCTARQYIIVEGYKHWDLTKANYLEACEICRKLFLGEEE